MLNVKFLEVDTNSACRMVDFFIKSIFENDMKPTFYIRKSKLEEMKTVNSKIYDSFVSYCINKGVINDDEKMLYEYKKITSEKLKDGYDFKFSQIDTVRPMHKLCGKSDLDVKSNLHEFIKNNFKLEDVIMLNIALFDGEIVRSEHKLFMQLYKMLIAEGYHCFLYSSYASPDFEAKRLYQKYAKIYGEDKGIKIYRRNGSIVGDLSDENKLIYEIAKFSSK